MTALSPPWAPQWASTRHEKEKLPEPRIHRSPRGGFMAKTLGQRLRAVNNSRLCPGPIDKPSCPP